jgi:hypothetical protein
MPTEKDKHLSRARYKKLKNNLREGSVLVTEHGSFLIKEIIIAPPKNQRYKTYYVNFYYIDENRADKVNIMFHEGIVYTDGYGFVKDFLL